MYNYFNYDCVLYKTYSCYYYFKLAISLKIIIDLTLVRSIKKIKMATLAEAMKGLLVHLQCIHVPEFSVTLVLL